MDTNWQPTAIDGVFRRSTPVLSDDRGAFMELWRASLTEPLGEERFVQGNLSRSRSGVLRGMHFHQRQADVWVLLEGRALAATTDLRPLLARTDRAAVSEILSLEPGDVLYLPRRVAHGFWAVEPVSLIYFVSNEYDGSDELGFAWNDPVARIPWPPGEPILSDRDRNNPPLADAIGALRD
jgi:dTDP-4-dehydrorhamnose 3,5-epimerase